MKQIKVSDKCSGCGLCIVNSEYLEENVEGNAQAILGKAIKSTDLEMMTKVVEDCPEGALSIIETGTGKSGKEGVEAVIASLNNKCDAIKVEEVTNSQVRLKATDYPLSVPFSRGELRYDYPSENAVKSAARDEFNMLCYSESAYRPMLKKVFVEYKVNVLKPYYNCQDEPESVYYKYNDMVRKYLADAYAEVCDLLGDSKVPASWKNFSVYPQKRDDLYIVIESLSEFEKMSTSSGIIAALKDLSTTSLSSYVDYMDFDYIEEYDGESFFGKSKYKKKWHFRGFDSAASSFIEDLTWAIDYQSYDIEDKAVNLITIALKDFEEKLKREFTKKIDELKNIVQ